MIKTLAIKSGIIHSEKQSSNSVTSNKTAQFVKNVFRCPDIVYTMSGMKGEITIWENGTKEHDRMYHLIMFLKEA